MRITRHATLAAAIIVACSGLCAQQLQPIARAITLSQQQSTPSTTQPRRVRISGGVMQGQLLNRVDPVYPEDARNSAAEGTVVLHVIVATDGTVESAVVMSGPEVFQKAAIDAVRQWTYKRYMVNGEPTEVDTTVTVNFNLNSLRLP